MYRNRRTADDCHLKLVYSSYKPQEKVHNPKQSIFKDRQMIENMIKTERKNSGSCENIMLFASGKGGVGKTWLTVNLAQAISDWGKKVLVFDADLQFSNVDVQLGLLPEYDLTQFLLGKIEFKKTITRYHLGGFDVIAGSAMSSMPKEIDPVQITNLWDNLCEISSDYDIVLVDIGSGVNENILDLCRLIKNGVMVTTDEPSSLSDVYTMMKLLKDNAPEMNLDIITNKVSNYTTGNISYKSLLDISKNFLNHSPKLLGVIRDDHIVPESIRNQVTTLTYAPCSKSIEDLKTIVPEIVKICNYKNIMLTSSTT